MKIHIRRWAAALLFLTALAAPAMAGDDNPPVKKSDSGICHARGTAYYSRTTHFTPYPSIEACLKSGGRLLKR